MRKVLISKYGEFSVSDFAKEELKKLGISLYKYVDEIENDNSDFAENNYRLREHPLLIQLFEEHGSKKISRIYVNEGFGFLIISDLQIVEIPDADILPEYKVIKVISDSGNIEDAIEMIIDPRHSWS